MLSEVDPAVLDFVRAGHMAGLVTPDGGGGDDSSGWHEGLHAAGDGVGAVAVAWMGWRSFQDAKSWWREKRNAGSDRAAGGSGGRQLPPARAESLGGPDRKGAKGVKDEKDANDEKGEPRLKRSVLLDLARQELIKEFELSADEPLEVREQDYEVNESAYRFAFESGADVYEVLVVTKGSRAAVVSYNHIRE
ncbi:hypothetical protein ACWEQO_01010 [Streptomyces sp. NPDC004051]